MRLMLSFVLCVSAWVGGLSASVHGAEPFPQVLPGTVELRLANPFDEVMVEGISRFAEDEIAAAKTAREQYWNRDYSSAEAYAKSVEANRSRFREFIGAVDPIVDAPRLAVELPGPQSEGPVGHILPVRWPTFDGVNGEGLLIVPDGAIRAIVITVPDTDQSPEAFVAGLVESDDADPAVAPAFLRSLLDQGCVLLVPAMIDRNTDYSASPYVARTNMPHREFIYRMAFEMGRHVIGYEVQKLSAARMALQQWCRTDANDAALPVAITGVGEGGLSALYTAAADPAFDAALVSGYFQPREKVWQEPIYRNMWRLLAEFGDAEIASLITPRRLIVEASSCATVDGPPAAQQGERTVAAPGEITVPQPADVRAEFDRAAPHFEKLGITDHLQLFVSGDGTGPAGSPKATESLLGQLIPEEANRPNKEAVTAYELTDGSHDRQRRQVDELVRWTQMLMHRSDKVRAAWWGESDGTSLERWEATAPAYRDRVYETLIGRIDQPRVEAAPKSTRIIEDPDFVGYRIALDVFPNVVAGGILLLPRDLKPGERRPVVVCQHGLEGIPEDTITEDPADRAYGPYKGFSAQLARRGFIVYAPQNPYRGKDRFRVLQRKSNPLGRSLFSYIIPQHEQTLEWLAGLPHVDAKRIGFYGLSYGGKTAVRVPPLVEGYCLSICSADYNEWVRKNTSSDDRYSYVFTGEYEIFEWNMGHTANYSELANLMTPRPFMVERGHHDGVAPDEWVAWEFAKVRRHYDELGIGDLTEIEWFNGPHTINGKGTFDFLHRHLDWPVR